MRVSIASQNSILVTLIAASILLGETGELYCQTASQRNDQGALGNLFADVRSEVTTVGSWSVVDQLVADKLDSFRKTGKDRDGMKAIATGERSREFDNPLKAMTFIAELRKSSVKASTKRLVTSGLPLSVAQAMSERLPRKHLFDLQKALLAYATLPNGLDQKQFASAIGGALRQSTTALLKPSLSANDYRKASEAIRAKLSSKQSAKLNAERYLVTGMSDVQSVGPPTPDELFHQAITPPQLLKIDGLDTVVFGYLKEDAKKRLESLPDAAREFALDGVAQDLLARAKGSLAVPSLPKLGLDDAVRVLTTVGQFQDMERHTAAQVYQGAQDLSSGLEAAHDLLQSQWATLHQQAQQITGNPNYLPPYVDQMAKTIHLVNDLSALSAGGQLESNTVSELAGLVADNIPGSDKVLNLAAGISQIANTQLSFAQQGQMLLGTLADITQSPQLKQVQSVFNSVAPILQSAGPLLAIAGFASPLGGVSIVSGLLGGGGLLGSSGGGPDYSAALQAINQKLAEIDRKLDLAIAKIDALDNKLTAQHVEVMNALESISFDVNRTLQGVNQTQVDTYSRECVDIQNNFHNDPELPIANRVDSYKRCNEQLNNVNAGLTKNFLKAIPNLSTVDFQNSALVKLRKIAALHSKSDNWAEKNCFSLAVASSSLHELGTVSNVGLEQAENTAGKDLCRDVRSISDMLDPGMLTFFTTLEWTAADFSWKLGQDHAQEVMWGNKKRQAVAYRWANELRLLNAAVGQQSILVGDVTVPNWAGKLDLKTALDQTDIDVLNENTILAQNSVRYWLQDHMDKTRLALQPNSSSEFGTSLKYAFAYFACSPDFLQSLTETGNDGSADFSTDFSRIHFRWSQAVKDQTTDFKSLDLADPKPCPTLSGLGARWCLKVDSLSTCIEMPTPDEATRGELLKSDNLEALINVREKIITLIETNDLIGGMNPDQRLRLIEALAIKWSISKVQGATPPPDGTLVAAFVN